MAKRSRTCTTCADILPPRLHILLLHACTGWCLWLDRIVIVVASWLLRTMAERILVLVALRWNSTGHTIWHPYHLILLLVMVLVSCQVLASKLMWLAAVFAHVQSLTWLRLVNHVLLRKVPWWLYMLVAVWMHAGLVRVNFRGGLTLCKLAWCHTGGLTARAIDSRVLLEAWVASHAIWCVLNIIWSSARLAMVDPWSVNWTTMARLLVLWSWPRHHLLWARRGSN